MNKYIGAMIAFVLTFDTVSASNTSDFQAEYDAYVKSQQAGFETYSNQHKIFIKQLKKEWQAYKSMPALVRDKTPKLPTAPVHVGTPLPSNDPVITYVPPSTDAEPELDLPVIVAPVDPIQDNQVLFEFYGQAISIDKIVLISLEGETQSSLKEYWQQSTNTNYEDVLQTLNDYKTELALSDWAFWLLVKTYVSEQVNNDNQQIALSWFLLNNLGYGARVALGSDSLILMVPTKQKLYGVSRFKIEGDAFYQIAGKENKEIRTYDADFDQGSQAFDMRFDKTLKTGEDIQYRTFDTQLDGLSLNLHLPYDLERVKFFKTYPQIDLRYYFEAPVGDISSKGLSDQMNTFLKGNDEAQLTQLLHLIHQAFPYALDQKQFGAENYLMVEESLHYQASDCEDRSILFAWLAKHLLNQQVVALNYPGHVSTAIFKDNKLIPADPTYIGADLGDVMPDYQGVKPKIIQF
ncbi:hypothetical protein A9Q77_10195 [Marinomonas sp. 42_23_T18]|nr:hypothetical protein A9Q77_10195 [Marinomonas sp. 42_23_T18]